MSAIFESPPLTPANQAFLSRKHKLYIDGKWVHGTSGETIDVVDPANARVVTQTIAGNASDVDDAVKAARRAFEGSAWRNMSGIERGKLLSRLARKLEEHADEFAELESLDCGKIRAYAKAVDVDLTARVYHYMAGWASKVSGETVSLSTPGNYHAFTLREPIGVVGAITPWNFPLVLTAYKLAPLLAVGCTVVIKPSELAPLSTLRFIDLIEEAGFPPGVVNVVTGYGTAGAALAEHPGVDKVSFTGSLATGRKIVAASAANLKRVTLELGGKSPMIVFPDVDIETAVPNLASAIFFHQGQVCTAGARIYIHQSIHDKVVEGIARAAQQVKMGHGLVDGTTMGPMISSNQLHKVLEYVDGGKRSGAEAVTGGSRAAGDGFFINPTVLTNVNDRMAIAQEEIFGPVLCAQSFDDAELDAIAARANDTPYGLAASVWTSKLSTAHKMVKKIRAGNVWVNCHNFYDPALPFGGMKQSGWGREEGSEAVRAFTELKSVVTLL